MATGKLWWNEDGSATAVICGGGVPYGHHQIEITPSGEVVKQQGNILGEPDFDTVQEALEKFREGRASE